ncbi:MAG: NYN domain-containing protein [Lentisphaerae bacterium]|nr:NYN domain-containing protein [Lentisphaerota bacterium]
MIKWLIIDGYNLLYRCGAELGISPGSLAGRRRQLIQLLERAVGLLAERITVVFDGRYGAAPARSATHSVAGAPAEPESLVVEVLFSPGNKTADTVIERLVFQAGKAGGAVVVTSDRRERETAEAAGAETSACSIFCAQLKETLARIEQDLSRAAREKPARSAPPGFVNPFESLNSNKPGD